MFEIYIHIYTIGFSIQQHEIVSNKKKTRDAYNLIIQHYTMFDHLRDKAFKHFIWLFIKKLKYNLFPPLKIAFNE